MICIEQKHSYLRVTQITKLTKEKTENLNRHRAIKETEAVIKKPLGFSDDYSGTFKKKKHFKKN